MPDDVEPWVEGTLMYTWRRKNARGNWSVIEEDGRRAMEQSTVCEDKVSPLLLAGEPTWRNYRLQVEMRHLSTRGRAGICGRVKDSLHYYTLYVEEGKKLILALAQASGWTILKEENCHITSDGNFSLILDFEGTTLRGELHVDGKVANTVEVTSDAIKEGKIGLWGDVPARFYDVEVQSSPEEREALKQKAARVKKEVEEIQRELPQPKLWKRIETPGFGAGRTLRFGDLNGDGVLEIVIPQNLPRVRGDSYSMISCITAVTLEGEVLWQIGEPSKDHALLTNDLAIQVYDIDGDGCAEVIFAKDFYLHIADGRTGRILRKVPTPLSRVPDHPRGFGPETAFDRIVGDSIFICNARGLESPRDILIKDRYNNVWVYDDNLELLWSVSANTGHFPFSMDVDGDGCDELFIGDSLFDHDGQLIWSLNLVHDHVDTVGVADLKGNGDPCVIMGASDEGLIFADMNGRILRRHDLGHVQMGNVANLLPDRPGLEVFTITYWGAPGIITICDSDGEIIRSFQPLPIGSHIEPLNWTGDGMEHILFSTSPHHPGILDGYGRNVLNLPDDGHPDLTSMAIDLTGDPRDEIVTWDPDSIWIYTQDGDPPKGEVYAPRRLPHYNASNYRAAISLPPGDSDRTDR